MATLGRVKLEQQIKHIKEHEPALLAKVGMYKSTESYFRAYVGEYPDLYERICEALVIEPKVK